MQSLEFNNLKRIAYDAQAIPLSLTVLINKTPL